MKRESTFIDAPRPLGEADARSAAGEGRKSIQILRPSPAASRRPLPEGEGDSAQPQKLVSSATGFQLFFLLLLFTAPCLAQETPAWQFFGGYSFQRADVREYFKTTPIIYTFRHHYVNMNGWDFSVTENRNAWFGGTLDLSGYYTTPQVKGISNSEKIYSVFYGPKISYPKPLLGGSAFAHVLFGATHTSVSVTPVGPHATDFTFGMTLGGGFDLPLRNELSVRVLQAEYLRNSSFGAGQNNYRLSAGVVFNLSKVK